IGEPPPNTIKPSGLSRLISPRMRSNAARGISWPAVSQNPRQRSAMGAMSLRAKSARDGEQSIRHREILCRSASWRSAATLPAAKTIRTGSEWYVKLEIMISPRGSFDYLGLLFVANVDWIKPTQGSVAKAIEICKVIKPKACLYQGPVDVLKVFDVRFTDHYVRISENRGRAV